jgi:hypothetical protein
MFVRETAKKVRCTVTHLLLLLSPTATDLQAPAIRHQQASEVSLLTDQCHFVQLLLGIFLSSVTDAKQGTFIFAIHY